MWSAGLRVVHEVQVKPDHAGQHVAHLILRFNQPSDLPLQRRIPRHSAKSILQLRVLVGDDGGFDDVEQINRRVVLPTVQHPLHDGPHGRLSVTPGASGCCNHLEAAHVSVMRG